MSTGMENRAAQLSTTCVGERGRHFPTALTESPPKSMIAIGVVASGLRKRQNRAVFEQGFYRMLDVLRPHTIVIYGSDKYPCFDRVRQQVRIIAFPSETSMAFGRRSS